MIYALFAFDETDGSLTQKLGGFNDMLHVFGADNDDLALKETAVLLAGATRRDIVQLVRFKQERGGEVNATLVRRF